MIINLPSFSLPFSFTEPFFFWSSFFSSSFLFFFLLSNKTISIDRPPTKSSAPKISATTTTSGSPSKVPNVVGPSETSKSNRNILSGFGRFSLEAKNLAWCAITGRSRFKTAHACMSTYLFCYCRQEPVRVFILLEDNAAFFPVEQHTSMAVAIVCFLVFFV